MKRNNKYFVLDVPGFESDLLKLARIYPSVISNIASLFEEFERGDIAGEDVRGLNLNGSKVFKTRLGNPDANKGASGGFRVIWFLVTTTNNIYPITIYSKSDQENIHPKEIAKLITRRLR